MAFDGHFSPFDTYPTAPSPIDGSSIGCEYEYNKVIKGSGGGAPATDDSPALRITLAWAAPRPNDVSLNARGPELYNISGPFGEQTFLASNFDSRVDPRVSLEGQVYLYARNYSFGITALNPAVSDVASNEPTGKTCSSPGFRPGPPTITHADIFARRVVLTWSEPEHLNCDECVVDQYLYQICKGDACSIGVGNKDESWQAKRFMCNDTSSHCPV